MFSHSSTVVSVRDDIIIIKGHDDIHIATFRAGLLYSFGRHVPVHSCQLPSPYKVLPDIVNFTNPQTLDPPPPTPPFVIRKLQGGPIWFHFSTYFLHF